MIEELKADVEASVFRIAPEREDELAVFFSNRTPQFVWTNKAKRLPSVNTQSAQMFLPAPGLTLLWAAALQSWVLYDEHLKESAKGSQMFSLFGSGRRIAAIGCFEWALVHFSDPSIAAPDGVLAPHAAPAAGSDEHVANELFLAAIAWILHHEIAHLQLGHTSITAIPTQEETDADTRALSWILDQESDEARRKKRVLGACVAILLITVLDLNTGSFRDRTHPRAFDRMFRMLEQARLPDNHVAFSFCTTMIRVEMSKLQIPIVVNDGTSWREICYEHLSALRSLTVNE